MKKLATISIAALTLSAIYLYAWPAPNLFYAVVVLFHVGLGVLFSIGGLRLLPRVLRQPFIVKAGTLALIVGAVVCRERRTSLVNRYNSLIANKPGKGVLA